MSLARARLCLLPLCASAFALPGLVARVPHAATARRCRPAGPQCSEPAAPVADEAATPAELKGELLDLIDDLPSRGLDADEDDAEDILEIIEELEPFNPWPDFSRSAVFGGTWRLLYTSSKVFHTNMGLMSYGRDVESIETPELLMKIQTDYRLVVFEEPLEYVGTSFASVVGGLMKADVLRAECVWRATANGILAIDSQKITAGGRSWVPADRQAKGIRAMSANTPVYLDDEIMLMRGQVPSCVWVWERD